MSKMCLNNFLISIKYVDFTWKLDVPFSIKFLTFKITTLTPVLNADALRILRFETWILGVGYSGFNN